MEWLPLTLTALLALAAVVAAFALSLARARALAALAAAETERDAAGAELSDKRGEIDRLGAELRELERRSAELTERVQAAERARAMELEAQERLYQDRLRAADERTKELHADYERRNRELTGRIEETFFSLSTKALKDSSDTFLKIAQQSFNAEREKASKELGAKHTAIDQLIDPIRETLAKTGERLELYEARRGESFARLHQQIEGIGSANITLREETGKLVKALSKPEVRGRYGEIQLKRVAELAGMAAYCDFTEQTTTRDTDGKALRPDMIVRMPNDRVVAVDAKTNTYAYLEALGSETPEARDKHLERFARHVAEQAEKLAKKGYWAEYKGSAEFVVMFVPGDHFLDAALERRPDLLDLAAQNNVILATPSTLIGLLRAVAVGWREKSLADEADHLFKLGRELHDRAAAAFAHAKKLGETLHKAVDHYNKFTASVDSRLTPTLRKFEETGAKGKKELAPPVEVTVTPRLLEAAHTVEPKGEASRSDDADRNKADGNAAGFDANVT